MKIIFKLWSYRSFILGNVKREFQLKYRNSLLGASWTIINPLCMVFVYTVIFSSVMKSKLPGVDGAFSYSIYLCSGILTWGLFSEILVRSQNVFLDNAVILKKIKFPRICLPVIVILNSLINFFIVFSIFTLFLLIIGRFPGYSYFAILPLLALQVIFSISLGIILGILNVFFRDIGQLLGVVIQFWFWLTPIVYSSDILPEFAKRFISYNPLFSLITSYQGIMVRGNFPDWHSLLPLIVISIVLSWGAVSLFNNHIDEIVDEL